MLIGDLNMVEIAEDLCQNLERIIFGLKKQAWYKWKKHFDMIDIGIIEQCTYQSYGSNKLLRKARSDKCFVLQALCAMYMPM